jgi:recombination protein RecT
MSEDVPAKVSKKKTLKDLLLDAGPALNAVATKHLTPERLTKIALVSVSRSHLLRQCESMSIVRSVIQAAQLGIDPSGLTGEGYLVPFWNKTLDAYEATFIIGYRGLIKLARRSGEIKSLEARLVYKEDEFEVEYGLNQKLRHVPHFDCDTADKNIRFAYCVARLESGETVIEVMNRKQLEKIRQRSKASDKGPWVTDFGEMCRKTVVRRAAKYLPLTAEAEDAIAQENQTEQDAGIFDALDAEAEDIETQDETTAEEPKPVLVETQAEAKEQGAADEKMKALEEWKQVSKNLSDQEIEEICKSLGLRRIQANTVTVKIKAATESARSFIGEDNLTEIEKAAKDNAE